MSRLNDFWNSEENQKKYGFTYENNSIYYKGDVHELLEIAFKWAVYKNVEDNSAADDPRPLLEIAIAEDGQLVLKDSGEEIETGVDGEGAEPNFYIRFTSNGEETKIRFNMRDSKLYPDNESCPYRFSMKSLTAINTFFECKCKEFAVKWNAIRPDGKVDLEWLPNYRAINRL